VHRFLIPVIAGIVLSLPAMAQDASRSDAGGEGSGVVQRGVAPAAGGGGSPRQSYSGSGIVTRGVAPASNIRVGDRLYDINTGRWIDTRMNITGPSNGLEEVRRALVAAGCLRPDEEDLSRHDCYINSDGTPVHRPARDDRGEPQGDRALCRDGSYSFSQHRDGTCSHHGGVQRWD